MAEESNGSKWSSWRKYVEEMAKDVVRLREKVTQLQIDLAVTKTKLAVYIGIIAAVTTIVLNLGFILLRIFLK